MSLKISQSKFQFTNGQEETRQVLFHHSVIDDTQKLTIGFHPFLQFVILLKNKDLLHEIIGKTSRFA